MKKIILSKLLLFIGACSLYAQIGIGTATPDPSARLEVSASNKGVFLPRVQLASTNDVTTISSPTEGLMVYNLSAAAAGDSAVVEGFYTFNGSAWKEILSSEKMNNFVNSFPFINPSVIAQKTTASGTINAQTAGQSTTITNFNIEDLDANNDFDLSTGTFTAPENGLYSVSYSILGSTSNSVNNNVAANILVNGASRDYVSIIKGSLINDFGISSSAVISLNTGDTLTLSLFCGSNHQILRTSIDIKKINT